MNSSPPAPPKCSAEQAGWSGEAAIDASGFQGDQASYHFRDQGRLLVPVDEESNLDRYEFVGDQGCSFHDAEGVGQPHWDITLAPYNVTEIF